MNVAEDANNPLRASKRTLVVSTLVPGVPAWNRQWTAAGENGREMATGPSWNPCVSLASVASVSRLFSGLSFIEGSNSIRPTDANAHSCTPLCCGDMRAYGRLVAVQRPSSRLPACEGRRAL